MTLSDSVNTMSPSQSVPLGTNASSKMSKLYTAQVCIGVKRSSCKGRAPAYNSVADKTHSAPYSASACSMTPVSSATSSPWLRSSEVSLCLYFLSVSQNTPVGRLAEATPSACLLWSHCPHTPMRDMLNRFLCPYKPAPTSLKAVTKIAKRRT